MAKLQLEISKSEASELLEFYTMKRSRLLKEHEEIFNKVNEYTAQINSLRKLMVDDSDSYPKGGSWNQKIQFVLRDALDGLAAREITMKIVELEKARTEEETKRIYNSVSPTLSTGVGSTYDRKTNYNGEFVYVLKN
jgi:hypothetical protein